MAGAVLSGVLLVGGVPGVLIGACAGVSRVVTVRRRKSPEERRRRERMAEDLPFTVDLMVACLRAGLPVSGAVEIAAEAVGGPLGALLSTVNARLRLGAAPEEPWAVLRDDPLLSALAQDMTRAAVNGAPVADALTRLAADATRETRAAASAAARRAGVQVIAPLGLCFLPAFVFLGIIPVVAGLASQAFGK
ncbi:type II secretion system F family protein [Sphaerisporangium sp. B11E5]|uniref:type II secretion system F family protein n=1 Tax=Sphaerisporangium sp. B11E5 TaxID=3153563 RepID=UPI00325E89C1